jgi:hypothetical protein
MWRERIVMASAFSGKVVSLKRNTTSDAALALETLFAGRHRDKRIAQAFKITPRMARYLLNGEHWLRERLEQLDALLEPRVSKEALANRLNQLERELATLFRLLRVGRGWE